MSISKKWLGYAAIPLVAVGGAVYLLHVGGAKALLELLTPRFRVMRVDRAAQTADLRQTNRTYTVRCGDSCSQLVVGKDYAAVDRGSDLQVRIGPRRLSCPIIKIEVQFETRPGGVGESRSPEPQIKTKTKRARTVLDVG